jgi:hypothetical protein
MNTVELGNLAVACSCRDSFFVLFDDSEEGLSLLELLTSYQDEGIVAFKSDILVTALVQLHDWGRTKGGIGMYMNLLELLKKNDFVTMVEKGLIKNIIPKPAAVSS